MTARLVQILVLTAFLISFTGCPSLSPIAFGTWLFCIDNDAAVAALILHEDGEVEVPNPRPPGADSDFEGAFVWSVDGNTFTLYQDENFSMSGTVLTRTRIINGTTPAGQAESFDWTAEKL